MFHREKIEEMEREISELRTVVAQLREEAANESSDNLNSAIRLAGRIIAGLIPFVYNDMLRKEPGVSYTLADFEKQLEENDVSPERD